MLTEDAWNHICHALNVAPGGGSRWRHARALLYCDLTGNAVRHIDAKLNDAEVDRFGRNLPDNVRHELDRTGREFLAVRGIDEPLTWTPPFDELPETGAEGAAGVWSAARPAFAVAGQAMTLEEIVVAYAAGTTTYELAEMTGVSRQTISRILAEAAMPTRRGRPNALDIDVARVRHLHEVEHKTMEQIAEIMGCSKGTICRRLRDPHPHRPQRRE
ncbi:helix-turn-helix domain-containing protein [Agromyces laixinhei]|uniref:helix-turn-helix domain-containing protein n=1 Tax=Agromyces laixinhei TaxID=2585717 RepID=UPI0012EE083F|nr:hypothetical protein [Agromyces laixinhei]